MGTRHYSNLDCESYFYLRDNNHIVELFDSLFQEWTDNEIKFNTANKQYKPQDYENLIKFIK